MGSRDKPGNDSGGARSRPDFHHLTYRLTLPPAARIFNHMVENSSARLDAVFHALGDGTRRQMLRALADGERTVGELAAPFSLSLAAASKHVRTLERAGLAARHVSGRTHRMRLSAGPLMAAHDWLGLTERHWSRRLDVLERLLGEDDAEPTPSSGAADGTPPRPPAPEGDDR